MQYYINNNDFNRPMVDFTNRIQLEFNLIFDQNGAHGNNARMIIYSSVEIYEIDINHYQRNYYIKVHSVYWNNYQLYNGECCLINSYQPCLDSCNYFVQFYISGKSSAVSRYIPSSKLQENRIYVYAVTAQDVPNTKYNISVVLRDPETLKLIEIGYIDSDEYSKVDTYHYINLKGNLGNADYTVSFGYLCHRYTSLFCINKCRAISKIEYCDYETGNRHCINGAKDINCEKNSLNF
ncbi:hypothetical protein HZS_5920 [Henneguya salminicola]|nr:hypothetical protein HZS_5920 [Henneguya salminicola]